MSMVKFNLIVTDTEELVKDFSNLKSCVRYIKMVINNPSTYSVDEVIDNDILDSCSALYLVENYKDLDKLPKTLFDC